MKNLIKKYSLRDLELMPINLLSFSIRKKHFNTYRRRHGRFSDYHDINNRGLRSIIDDICKKYLNKPYNDAYSEYCKKVEWYQRKEFKNALQRYYSKYFFVEYDEFIIDNEGIIRINPKYKYNKYKGPYSVTSSDIQYELRHKITGHKKVNLLLFMKMLNILLKVKFTFLKNFCTMNMVQGIFIKSQLIYVIKLKILILKML